MRRITILIALLAAVVSASPVSAAPPENVALGASVTLHGDAFFTAGWGGGQVVPASTVTDGQFLPRYTQWDQGTVWWDQNDGRKGEIILTLPGRCSIQSVTLQADDNDAYSIRYWDNGWKNLWNVPNYDAYGWGMQTRPDPTDDTAVHVLQGGGVATTRLLIKARPNASNDMFFAVSEIQAFGRCQH